MTTKQQQEALAYFSSHAADWRSKAEGKKHGKVNVIEQRNGFVLQVAQENPQTASFLDVGCGTGELACAVAALGIPTTGVDYAPEMVDLATQKAADEGIDGISFVCSSVFDFDMASDGYDLIAANGFVEYLSVAETDAFFGLAQAALRPGGSLVVGSRNRLFNLFSMNAYTLQEIEAGDVESLLRESIAWTTAQGLSSVLGGPAAPVQVPGTEHATTGIDVTARFQFTPLQLTGMLEKHGFTIEEVYPVHVHGVTPAFGKEHAPVHVSVANLLQSHARHEVRMLPHASSFMLHVRKS